MRVIQVMQVIQVMRVIQTMQMMQAYPLMQMMQMMQMMQAYPLVQVIQMMRSPKKHIKKTPFGVKFIYSLLPYTAYRQKTLLTSINNCSTFSHPLIQCKFGARASTHAYTPHNHHKIRRTIY
jgi:hypothetical protein